MIRAFRGRWARVVCPLCNAPQVHSTGRYVAFKCSHAVRQRIRLPGLRAYRLASFKVVFNDTDAAMVS